MKTGELSKFVILDRDGTVIAEKEYLRDPNGVALLPGAREGLSALASNGVKLIIVTNQSGVGRKYFSMADVDAVNTRMTSLLAEAGVMIAQIYVCPHAPIDNCDCRKPRTGMIQKAAHDHGFDPASCWVIGDKAVDVDLGRNVGAKTILVRTGYGADLESKIQNRPDYIADNLADAAEIILRDSEVSNIPILA